MAAVVRSLGSPSTQPSDPLQPGQPEIVTNPKLASLVTDAMDVRTLVTWRKTCRANSDQVAQALRRSMTRILFPFLPCTRNFMRHVTDHRAVIGGEVALAFILRDPLLEPRFMEIYTGYGWFQPFIDNIAADPVLSAHLRWVKEKDVGYPFVRLRSVRKFCIYVTTNGRRVIVFESTTMSPCSPISRSWCTAMMNFVTEDCFGSAYPRLLENRRALVPDLSYEPFHVDEEGTMERLIVHGFSFSALPAAWPEFNNPPLPPRPASDKRHSCMRQRFACPDQGRFFGDGGSLVGLVDPFTHNFDFLSRHLMPPFGHMPVWRLWNSNVCDAGCACVDPVLPRGIISITMLYSADTGSFLRHTPTGHLPGEFQDLAQYVTRAARGQDD